MKTIDLINDLVSWQREYRMTMKDRKLTLDEKEEMLKSIEEEIIKIQSQIIENWKEENKLSTTL